MATAHARQTTRSAAHRVAALKKKRLAVSKRQRIQALPSDVTPYTSTLYTCEALPHRITRAPFPFITASTSLTLTIDVSPGVVIASAPCAAPYSTADCGPLPSRNPYASPEAKPSPPPTRS